MDSRLRGNGTGAGMVRGREWYGGGNGTGAGMVREREWFVCG